MKPRIPVALIAAATCGSVGAQAVDKPDYPNYEPGAAVKNGYTAEHLIGAEVRGTNQTKIGDVEDLIMGPDGQLRRLVVAIDQGWFGTGGRRLAIDFKDVTPKRQDADDIKYLQAPVNKRNVEDYGLFKDKPKAVKGGPREWRATELIGDYVNLKDLSDYGLVTDLMFDRQGQLRAIAATSDVTFGRISQFYTPYDQKGWEPGDEYYVVPYSAAEIRELLPEKQSS